MPRGGAEPPARMSDDTMTSHRVRREAGILTDDQLTFEQGRARDQILDLLREMVTSDDVVDEPKQPCLPRIDPRRHNRVLLIDGGRGAGKTALLVTLLHHLRASFGEIGQPRSEPEASPRWTDNERRIMPVGLLDLHPLPPSTNLLFHLVGRLERVVECLEGESRDRDQPAWCLAEGKLASRRAWDQLLRAVAAGWDGNLALRRGTIDLEAYTVELEETERQRLNVIDTFAAFVDALVKDFKAIDCGRRKGAPLFVLAIDDADMNPVRSVELLNVVRILWHPRVAFLLTGDSDLFLHVLSEHYLGELRGPLRGHHVTVGEVAAVAANRPVSKLATEFYDKIIPAGHRCRVSPIPPARRLHQTGTDLAEIFDQIHAESPREHTLAWCFTTTPQLCEALPDRLRALIDTADMARLEARETSPLAASRIAAAIWRHALRVSRAVPPVYHEDTVIADETTGAIEIQLAEPLGVWADMRPFVSATSEGAPALTFNTVHRLDGVVNDTGAYLPRPLTAALMLAADVAAEQTDGAWLGPNAEQDGYEGIFAASTYQPKISNGPIRFAWPLPARSTLPFYAAFSSRWSSHLKRYARRGGNRSVTPEEVGVLARQYLHLVIYLWRGSTDLRVSDKPPSWEELARRLIKLAERGGTFWRSWAISRAGLLAAPEYGLPAEAANAWLNALIGTADSSWGQFRDGMSSERRLRVDAGGAQSTERVCSSIDEAFATHRWRDFVEEKRL